MDVQAKLHELERRYAELGLPATIQRRTTMKVLAERCDHPTADAVYSDVVEALPGVSKATVYRVLDHLVEVGLARRVHHDGGPARFDGNVERHHHLVCLRCDRITDVSSDVLPVGPLSAVSVEGFEARDVSVNIQGLCRACATGSEEKEP